MYWVWALVQNQRERERELGHTAVEIDDENSPFDCEGYSSEHV